MDAPGRLVLLLPDDSCGNVTAQFLAYERTNHQQQAGRSTEKAQDKTPPIEPTTNGVLIGQVNSTVRIPKRINTSTKTSLASFQATKKERRQKFICLSELQCLGEYCTTATVQLARYEKQDTEVQRLGSRGS